MPSFREAPVQSRALAAVEVDPVRVRGLAFALGADLRFDAPELGTWYGLGAAATLESTPGDSPFAIVDAAERALAAIRAVPGSAPLEPVWLGGFAFDPARTGVGPWAAFPPGRLVLPQVALHVRGGKAWALEVAETSGADGLLAQLEKRLAATSDRVLPTSTAAPHFEPELSRASWDDGIRGILRALESGGLHKAVLARTLRAELSGRLELHDFLPRLRARFPDCALYAFPSTNAVFLGATPEWLFVREGTRLRTMALAGSARRDPDPGRDAELGRALLADPKENAEHQWVAAAIRDALAPITSSLDLAGPRLRTLKNIQHLETSITAELAEGVGTRTLLERLHPTPAVCGTPREPARRLLRELEPFPRGWYAGPIGIVGRETSAFAVALRCMLIEGTQARLFVGAGIVAGSDAEREWRETELKSRALRDALSEVRR